MALNLSTLTNSATSGDVLAEALTTADFLEPVPVLRNLARGSQKGGDAKQGTALNQPKALPLDANGKGYLYLCGVSGNYASVPDPLGSLGDFTMQIDGLNAGAVRPDTLSTLISQYDNSSGFDASFILRINTDGTINLVLYTTAGSESLTSSAVPANTVGIQVKRVGTIVEYLIDTGSGFNIHDTDTSNGISLSNASCDVQIGVANTVTSRLKGKISRAIIWDNGTQAGDPVLDVDFTATNIRHGDTKFKCATGQVVTINQSGNDPATVIKKSVLRFDGANSSLQGLFANNIDGGYMFAAFSVLGDGGELYGRIFSVHNSASAFDYTNFGFIFSLREQATNDLGSYYNSIFNLKNDLFDADNGDILHEVRSKSGQHLVSVNGDSLVTNSRDTSSVDSNTFNISKSSAVDGQAAIDLEFLALFPATITDAQADSVRNYINNRNNVFDLKDGFGYYFYDAQKAPVGAITTGSASWNGRIVGSDFGDADKLATQATANDQPVSDGFKVTFADNSDHLDIPSTTQAGWQVVGTSLGTFAYRVNADAVTELNLLGNAGAVRSVGDLYGIILLPAAATGADIEAARKLLIDRGAADGTTSSAYSSAWYQRNDIVEFKNIDFTGATNLQSAWQDSTSLTSFSVALLPDATDVSYAWRYAHLTSFNTAIPLVTNAQFAWFNCNLMDSFGTTEIPNCTNFTSSWQNCSALTSFPSGAKLGTEASNVNFSSAWRSSGLTSFSTPLPTADILVASWRDCSSMTSFSVAELPLATDSRQSFLNCDFSTFSTEIPKSKAFQYCWSGCSSLTDFSADVFANWNPVSLYDSVFDEAWSNCTSLTAQSVENILVSIDASGKYATTTGASGGSALANAGIDIDYNVATGSLSAATDAAIDSLIGKGWQVFINGVLVVPNILDLAPAAAYSLRSFDAALDPDVVNVRRSSDNTTNTFKASEVSDGTLVAWVGAGNDGHVTTWLDQSPNAKNALQIFASNQPKIVESGTLVTEGGLAGINFHTETSYLFLNHQNIYGQSTLDSYYVTKSTGNRYIYPSLLTNGGTFGMVADLGGTASTSTNYGSPTYYANGSQITGTTRGAIWAATSNTQKLVVHQGANTTNSAWGISNMNFGNYNNDSEWGFTGKLQEMIFFNTDQSANRLGIAANINDHFDIYS